MVWWDIDDCNGDDELRGKLNLSMQGGVTPEGTWSDYGDSPADERGTAPQEGVHYSSADEVYDYYDSTLRDQFRLTNTEDD